MFASHCYGLGLSPYCCLGLTLFACEMSFTLLSQCLVVFPLGFSSTLRRARNCSDWNCLIRLTGLARTCSGWRKISGFTFTYISTWFCYHWDISVNLWIAHLLIHSDEILFWTSLEIGSKIGQAKRFLWRSSHNKSKLVILGVFSTFLENVHFLPSLESCSKLLMPQR